LNVLGCRDAEGKGSAFNHGGYCNPRIDALAKMILVEPNTTKRNDMIAEAYRLVHQDAAVIPLHQQSLVWGVANGVDVAQRADGILSFDSVRKH